MISSRTLLLILAALNLVAFLWVMGFLSGAGSSGRQPDRLNNEIEPDKLDVVRPAGNGADARGAGIPGLGVAARQLAFGVRAPDTGDPNLLATMAQPGAGELSAASMTSRVTLEECVVLPETDYNSAQAQLGQFASSQVEGKLRRVDSGSYLVFLTPLESTVAAQARRRELLADGVDKAQVIANGSRRNGLSLGLVRTAEQAELRLRELRLLGVTDAAVGPLSTSTSRYRTELRGPALSMAQSVRPAITESGLSVEACE